MSAGHANEGADGAGGDGSGASASPALALAGHERQISDSSMMPPPTPGSVRSSGRIVRPTLKLRVDRSLSGAEDSDDANEGPSTAMSSRGHSMQTRIRPSLKTPGASSSAQAIRARRLRLNINREQRIRGRGDPTYAGAKKTIPYMQGYDRELDSSDDETGEGMAFEEQIILRMPEKSDVTRKLSEWVRRREVGTDGHEVELKFKDSRRAVFKVGDQMFSSKLVDLPAIIESHKTLDNKQMFKIADISQMLLVTHAISEEADVAKPNPEPIEGLADDFVYDHGITPPMRWARKRRFRKRIHKRTIETVENEVERLLLEDERADQVEYKMIDAAEADLSDSDGEDGADGRRRRRAGRESSIMDDGTSTLADGDERSMIDDFEEGSFAADDDDFDHDLQRELEEEMLLQQQEEEEEEDEDEDDDDVSSAGGSRRRRRARSSSRATSEDDDDEDDDDDDDLFDDAGEEDEPRMDAEQGYKAPGEEGEEDDDDDDLDEEEAEMRVREQQLEAECREIEGMVKRKQAELSTTANALIKQRNEMALKKIQAEFEAKRSLLQDLRQERRDGKAAAKAEAQAQAEEQAAAAAAAAAGESNAAGAADNVTGTAGGDAVQGASASSTADGVSNVGGAGGTKNAAGTMNEGVSNDSAHSKRSSGKSTTTKAATTAAAAERGAEQTKKVVRMQQSSVEDAEARQTDDMDDEGDEEDDEEDEDEDDDLF